jgi:hypothetical protein
MVSQTTPFKVSSHGKFALNMSSPIEDPQDALYPIAGIILNRVMELLAWRTARFGTQLGTISSSLMRNDSPSEW